MIALSLPDSFAENLDDLYAQGWSVVTLISWPRPILDEQRDGWTDGWMDEHIYGHTNSPCILQDFLSSGSLWGRCPAHTIPEQGNVTDDHLLPLST